jgi:hypothetical protein
MYCELDDNKVLMGYSDQPSAVSVEIDKPIPTSTSTQVVKWDGSDWIVEDSQALIDEKALYDSQKYARNRQAEYPPMADQLDYMFHNGFDKWKEDIVQPVKDKYPKPE